MTEARVIDIESPSQRLDSLQAQVASMQKMCHEMRQQLFALSTGLADLNRELRMAEREQSDVEFAALERRLSRGADAHS